MPIELSVENKTHYVPKRDYKTFLELKRYSQNTINQYILFVNKYIDTYGHVLRQEDVDDFLLKYPYKTARYAIINYIKDYWHGEDLIHFERIKGQDYKTLHNKYLVPSEYKKLVEHPNFPLREKVISRLLFEGAVRIGEVLGDKKQLKGIYYSNIDWENKTIIGFGKENKQFSINFTSKTEELLKKYLENNPKSQDIVNDACRVFPICSMRYWQILDKFSKEIINKHISSHWFKRSAGYLYETMNLDLEQRQYLLHHANPKVTQESYSFIKGKNIIEKVKLDLENL